MSIISTMLMVGPPVLQADEPPSFQSYEVNSAHGHTKARVTVQSADPEGKFMLTVTDNQGTKLWNTNEFADDGYAGGLFVTDDGTTAIKVSEWNERIVFYRQGKQSGVYSLEDIPFDWQKIEKTTSHRHWVKSAEMRDYGKAGEKFVLTTIDGREHYFDLSGRLYANH